MGRPERPITTSQDAVRRLAIDLRALRKAAGAPTYRAMAEQVHFSASALSQAANGQRLPTLAVVQAFVAACGGDREEWTRRWHDAAEQLPAAPTRADIPDPAGTRRWSGRPITASLVALALLVVGGLLLGLFQGPLRPEPVTAAAAQLRPSPSPEGQQVALAPQPAQDGADPKRSGCASDAVTIDSASLVFPAHRLAGTVELRYSPHCAAAWTRFVPAPTGRGPDDTVTVVISRPSDAVRLPFTITYGDEAVFSDILITSKSCVVATASITNNGKQSPAASTGCRTGPA